MSPHFISMNDFSGYCYGIRFFIAQKNNRHSSAKRKNLTRNNGYFTSDLKIPTVPFWYPTALGTGRKKQTGKSSAKERSAKTNHGKQVRRWLSPHFLYYVSIIVSALIVYHNPNIMATITIKKIPVLRQQNGDHTGGLVITTKSQDDYTMRPLYLLYPKTN